jgi:DNA polymerase-3 subunit delta
LVTRLIAQWDSARLAKVAERAGKLERDIMLTGAPPGEALGDELVAIARQARRR